MSYPGRGKANYHDARFGPLSIWQLNDTLADTGVLGATLVVEAGTSVFCDVLPGLRGFYFDGSTNLVRSSLTPQLQITGDLTVECIVTKTALEADKTILCHDGQTESSSDNYLYDLYLDSSNQLVYFAEFGSGSNISYTSTGLSLPLGAPVHVALVRRSNQSTFYVNGRQFGPSSSGLVAPEGGANGRFRIGGDFGSSPSARMTGAVSSVKILNKSLTAAQVAEDYNVTLGGVYGYL